MKATCILLILFSFKLITSALKMVVMDIPSPVSKGENVELMCLYDLEEDTLYSIAWYKNDAVFYRYVPKDWPPGQFMPLPGVDVDLSKSGSKSVYLRKIDLNSTGTYRCEVTAESPVFQTVDAEKDMNVIVLPTEGPEISGGQSRYDVGDVVDINCTSAKSKPAATLRWYINEEIVDADYETEYSTTLHEDGLETSSLSLRFVVAQKHFKERNMKLKCTASVSRLYSMSNEESFVGGNQQSSQLEISEDREHRKLLTGSSVDLETSENSGVVPEKLPGIMLMFSVILLMVSRYELL